MKEEILEISEKLRLGLISESQCKELLLKLMKS